MFFNSQREQHEAQVNEIVKLRTENDKLKRNLSLAQGEAHERRQGELKHFTEKAKIKRDLAIANEENEKFQKINDELIARTLLLANKQNVRKSDEKLALDLKKKELEQQAKYTAELRSYISTLHEKVRSANVDRKHHEERANELRKNLRETQDKLLEEKRKPKVSIHNNKSTYDLKREKALLEKRVSELYNAIDKIDDLVSEVI